MVAWRPAVAVLLIGVAVAALWPYIARQSEEHGDACPLVRTHTLLQTKSNTTNLYIRPTQGYTTGPRPAHTYPTPSLSIVYNTTRIWTAWSSHPHATAMLINTTAGAIVKLADDAATLWDAHPGAVPLDMQGNHVIPGLIDAHVHYILGGLTLQQLDLRSVASKEQFQAAMQAHAGV